MRERAREQRGGQERPADGLPGRTRGPGPAGAGRDYLERLRVRNYSADDPRARPTALRHFRAWCAERALTRPREITKPILERYQRSLFLYRKKDGAPLGFSTQRDRLAEVRAFFKCLARTNHLLANPAADLELPRAEQRLPRTVLNAPRSSGCWPCPTSRTASGLRDRAILETFYSTGIRRSELCRLSVYDLDAERGTLLVREGKWKKDRMVPIGERALAWVEKYLARSAPASWSSPIRRRSSWACWASRSTRPG